MRRIARIKWTEAIDRALLNRVADRLTYFDLQEKFGIAASSLGRRAALLGLVEARVPKGSPAKAAVNPVGPAGSLMREPLKAGDPLSWGLINAGTILEGSPYDVPLKSAHTASIPSLT